MAWSAKGFLGCSLADVLCHAARPLLTDLLRPDIYAYAVLCVLNAVLCVLNAQSADQHSWYASASPVYGATSHKPGTDNQHPLQGSYFPVKAHLYNPLPQLCALLRTLSCWLPAPSTRLAPAAARAPPLPVVAHQSCCGGPAAQAPSHTAPCMYEKFQQISSIAGHY